MKKQILKTIYVVTFMAAFVLFGAVSLFYKNDIIGNEEKVTLGGVGYKDMAGNFDDYFSKSFGFRDKLVNINNSIKYNIFKQSGEKSVIAGRDGWLFYESALHDYTGENVMTREEAAKAAGVIKEMSDYAKECGTKLIFVSAPNKMEIYGEYMPYYCLEDKSDGNYELLMDELSHTDVDYVDLKEILKEAGDESSVQLYHKEDSHWNNLGAAYAYRAIMQKAGVDFFDYTSLDYTIQDNFDGDLYSMLFPEGSHKDEQVMLDMEQDFYFTSNYRSDDDLVIETANDNASGSVLVYRDSFGNALYQYFAEDFNTAKFTRAVPYDLTGIGDYDVVVIELVERNLANLIDMEPVMPR